MKPIHADINQWVMLYTKDLLSWAYHKTSNLHTAEDLVQDTFTAAVESISSFRKDSQPKKWLLGILNNKISDHYRKKTKNNHLSLDAGGGTERFFGESGH
jgi:RNA polymerase sigma-70 factor (ECF subfamily)